MVRYLLLFALTALPGMADVMVSSYVFGNGGPLSPPCAASDTGASSASTSFSCQFQGTFLGNYSGNASGETGVGPYGIGIQMSAGANQDDLFDGRATSVVSINWNQEFAIEGATGSGFVTPTVSGSGCGNISVISPNNIQINLFGQGGLLGGPTGCGFGVDPIPVTFGTAYDITMSGFMECSGVDQTGCGSLSTYVSSLVFTDAQGNVLPDARLVAVPEVSSWSLTATLMAALFFVRKSARRASLFA